MRSREHNLMHHNALQMKHCVKHYCYFHYRREQALQLYSKRRSKSILKPVIEAQKKIDRLSKKKAHKCISDPGTSPDTPTPNGVLFPAAAAASPTRSRRQRTRHSQRRATARSAAVAAAVTSPVKSPTKEDLHNELQSKTSALKHTDSMVVMPSQLKHIVPGMAVREMSISRIREYDDADDERERHCCAPPPPAPPPPPIVRNLNDVCFGCDGSCGDDACSSKRNGRPPHSSSDYSPGTSPSQGAPPPPPLPPRTNLECDFKHIQRPIPVLPRRLSDSNSNPPPPPSPPDTSNDRDSDHNGNSQSNSPVKTPSPKSGRCMPSPKKSPKSPRGRSKKFKRLCSASEAPDESPSKKIINGSEDNGNEHIESSTDEDEDDDDQQAVHNEMR